MEDSERKSYNGLKIGGATLLALAAAGYFSAEPIAKRFFDAPHAPRPPEPVQAQREPVNIAIAVDRTPSAVSTELPTIRMATREFLEGRGILRDGDGVTLCTFAERAECRDFRLPGGKAELIQAIDGIVPERRRGIETHVAASVRDVVSAVYDRENPFVVAWTDAIEEGDPVPAGTERSRRVPVRIVVPRSRFLSDASNVSEAFPADDIQASVATNGGEFGEQLGGFVGGLTRDAQTRAQATADRQHQSAMQDFERQKSAYELALRSVQEKIENVKAWINRGIGGIMAAFGILVFLDYRERKRPRISGYIVKKRGAYDNTFPLSRSKVPVNILRMVGFDMTLSPSKQGVTLEGRVLQDGEQIAEGVSYHISDPRIKKPTKRS